MWREFIMKKIQILGTGCPKCEELTVLVGKVADEMGIEYELSKVKDITEIIAMGVVKTPAIAIDGVVKISGKIPSVEEIKEIL
jgi:small redox-active disulfide protein 2